MASEEMFLENGRLLDRAAWEARISSLKAEVNAANAAVDGKKAAISLLKKRIPDAVAERIPLDGNGDGRGKFGVMFSGGVDSSIIAFLCKKLCEKTGRRFVCYTAGFGSSKDVEAAKYAAGVIGLELKAEVFELEKIEGIVRAVLPVLRSRGVADTVNVGVASVVYAVASMGKKDGVSFLFSGLGSEEIFAGYQRHEKAAAAGYVNEECWAGLKQMWSRDLLRDCALAELTGASFLTPFLDEKVVAAAMSIPGSLKISGREKKLILREAALELGLPEQVAFRKKIAAQYGSGFDLALGKLAKRHGFRLKSAFVESLVQIQ